MPLRYSIADARASLPAIVDQAEAGSPVELTRRGRPVAAVVSLRELQRLKGDQPHFAAAYRRFLGRWRLDQIGLDKAFAPALRDRAVGRKVVV